MHIHKLIKILSLSLLISFISSQAIAQGCEPCQRNLNFVWPVKGVNLAEAYEMSYCDTNWWWSGLDGHYGTDLHCPDDENFYAAFDGYVTEENVEPTNLEDNFYDIGRYIVYRSVDGSAQAIYGHVQKEGLARPGHSQPYEKGDVLGKCGGGQNHTDRGDSPGPRLYFELQQDDGTGNMVDIDPFTCLTNTCKYWYVDENTGEDCVPTMRNSGECTIDTSLNEDLDVDKVPSFACNESIDQWGNPKDDRWYVRVRMGKGGQPDLTCEKHEGKIECRTEVYNWTKEALLAEAHQEPEILNCFFRFIRVFADGNYKCGRIEGNPGTATSVPVMYVNWNAYNKQECEKKIVGLGVSNLTTQRNIAIQSLMQVEQGDYHDYHAYVGISSEYRILGVDDHERIDGVIPGRVYWDPAVEEWSRYYTLVRECDLAGNTIISDKCKTQRMADEEDGKYNDTSPDYLYFLDAKGYEPCEFILFDAGKYFDEPYAYISIFWMGRMAADKGLIFYK